jgi:biopolymer transport protein ExbD
MAINLGPTGGEERDELTASINTTPLVDIMLVLLIIFLITIPVVTHTVPVVLPRQVNQPTQTTPRTITLSIDKEGELYWNDARLADVTALRTELAQHAADRPQPEVHIRVDREVRYEIVGRVVAACRRAGIGKVAFILEPDRSAAGTP